MISQSRFNSRFAGLNSVAKKVYAATPIAEPWTVQQICTELVRLGTPMELRVVHGSLGAMTDMDLLKEPSKNCYIREQVRAVNPKQATAMEIAMTKANTATATAPAPAPVTKPTLKVPVTKTATPLEQLNDLAQRVNRLSTEIAQVVEDISEAIIVVQVQQEADAAELAQLRQLKAVLKGLGMGTV